MGDPIASHHLECMLGVEVHEQDLQLVAIPAIDETRRVQAGHAVAQGESAARLDEPGGPRRQGHGHPGGNQRPAAARSEGDGLTSSQVRPGIAIVGVRRGREVRVKSKDRDAQHPNNATRPRRAYPRPMLVWMDLEMTGLDPDRHVIVEIATLITDDELNVVAEGPDLVVHQPPEAFDAMDDFVRDMHTKSGLLEAIAASTISLDDAGAQTLAFIKEHVPEARSVPLCGNSIGTDRRFLAKHLNEIEEYLHYRSVDVSTIKELARRWYPKALSSLPRKATAHRALDDIQESIAELRFYREQLFVPIPPGSPAPALPEP